MKSGIRKLFFGKEDDVEFLSPGGLPHVAYFLLPHQAELNESLR